MYQKALNLCKFGNVWDIFLFGLWTNPNVDGIIAQAE
jgi:hypothetical protein